MSDHKSYMRDYNLARRTACIARGICTKCSDSKARQGFRDCAGCAEADKGRKRGTQLVTLR